MTQNTSEKRDSHTWDWVISTHLCRASVATFWCDPTKCFSSSYSAALPHKVWLPYSELTQYSVYGGRSRVYWAKLGVCHDTAVRPGGPYYYHYWGHRKTSPFMGNLCRSSLRSVELPLQTSFSPHLKYIGMYSSKIGFSVLHLSACNTFMPGSVAPN